MLLLFDIVIDMKKNSTFLIAATIFIVGVIIALFLFSAKSPSINSSVSSGECSQFSNKSGYTGCMSLTIGKEKKCKFKVNNKINQSTQKMEFEYLCVQK